MEHNLFEELQAKKQQLIAFATKAVEYGWIPETKEEATINRKEIEKKIREIIGEVKEKYKHYLDERDTRYYFVEEFIETDYKKISIGGMLGNRLLNLEKFFNNEIPDVKKIADTLKNKEWE